jgi:hypothetical protein
MIKPCNGVLLLLLVLLAGCDGASGAAQISAPRTAPAHAPGGIGIGIGSGVADARAAAQMPGAPAVPVSAGHSTSRTISTDQDADGIADYRVVITETFDAEGNLVSRTREQDFDADGVIDARSTISYSGG